MKILKKTVLLSFIAIVTFGNSIAQVKPTDVINNLPEFFYNVCSATNEEVEAYAEYAGTFADTVHKSLNLLSDIKIKARSTVKLNPNADIKKLQEEKVLAERSLNISRHFDNEFDKVRNSDNEIKKKMDEVGKQIEETTDWQKIEQLGIELIKLKADYCRSCIQPYLELLGEQREMLKANISNLVTMDDLEQKINCKLFGYTYFPELSYENAYFLILDHFDQMGLLMVMAPGEVN